MLKLHEVLSGVRRHQRLLALVGAAALSASGCLKSLDESLIPDENGGGSGNDASGGVGGGGTAGTGGSPVDSGLDGTDGPVDSAPDAQFFPYDPMQHPVTNIFNRGEGPVLITSDGTNIYHAVKNKNPSTLASVPILLGAGTPIASDLIKPQAMSARAGSLFIHIGAGVAAANDGSVRRISNTGTGTDIFINLPGTIELPVGMHAAADNFIYVSSRAIAKNRIALFRVPAGGSSDAEALYTTSTGNESGGDVTMQDACVYWISDGKIYVIKSSGGTRVDALATQINDALGITSDANNIYYTRTRGEVWQKPLADSGCVPGSAAERRIAEGFTGIGDVVSYGNTLAWAAKGDSMDGFKGGGVFSTAVGGIDVTQIAPSDDGVEQIITGPNVVIYTTANGFIRRVPQ